MRLLLVEADDRQGHVLAAELGKAGFAVDRVSQATDGGEALRCLRYAVVILDLERQGADGLTAVAALRRGGNGTPIIVLSARDRVADRVASLDRGADDCLTKPFAMEELIARIRVQMRRPGSTVGSRLMQGNLVFDLAARETVVGDRPLALTRREMGVLEVLMRRAGRVVPKSAIEDALYPFGEEIASNAIEVLVHRLRKRLLSAGADVAIQTVRGVGYQLSGAAA